MAKETVERILKAEAAAQSASEQAKAKAEKILLNAQGKAELIMNDAKRALKEYEDEIAQKQLEYSKIAFKEAEESANSQTQALSLKAAQNREAAVKAAMDILI